MHVGIHMAVMLLLFESPSAWWFGLLTLGFLHFLIDWGKLQVPIKPQALGFSLDQVLHAISLIPIALYFPQMQSRLPDAVTLPYLLIGLACPVLMFFWTLTFDVPVPASGSTANRVYTFVRRRFLTISQVVGFLLIGLILFQLLF